MTNTCFIKYTSFENFAKDFSEDKIALGNDVSNEKLSIIFDELGVKKQSYNII